MEPASTTSEGNDAIQLFSSKRKQQQLVLTSKKIRTAVEHASKSLEGESCSTSERQVADEQTDGKTNRTEPSPSFKHLGLTDWLCKVVNSLGIVRPTSVQTACIPPILQGKDVIGLAQTGSGKTAAFALPILQHLAQDPFGVFAIILTPTRELAFQISEQLRAFGAGMALKEMVVTGGQDFQTQAKELSRRPHIVTATPGRLKELIVSCHGISACFANCRYLVMDEADQLFSPSFESDLMEVLSVLPPAGPARRTLLFSATMTKSLIRLQQAALHDVFVYKAYEGLRTVEGVTEQYVLMPAKVKEVYLHHLLSEVMEQRKVRSAILFCRTCRSCALLAGLLQELGLPAAALHSGLPQKQRLAALQRFKSEAVPLLLATDVASRGLDIPTVDLVVHYDLPVLARDYIHRTGRTARAGRTGWSLCFVTQYDVDTLHQIEALIGHELGSFEMEEAEVLKGITKVYKSKRAAIMKADETTATGKQNTGPRKKGKSSIKRTVTFDDNE